MLFDVTDGSWLKTRYEDIEKFSESVNDQGITYSKYTFSDKKKDTAIAAITPAIHLYKEGFLIDTISGKPESYSGVVDFDRDIRLWMDTTVQNLRSENINGLSYKFNGTYNIDIRVFNQ